MKKNDFITSIFLTDSDFGIFCLDKNDSSNSRHMDFRLDDGVILNGYIQKPYDFLNALKIAFKTLRHKPKELNFVFLGQNVLIREIIVKKEALTKTNVYEYIESQVGISIHFPFSEAAYYYEIKSENDNEIEIIVFIIDKNLLEDYYDVFEKIGIKNISISLLSTDINHLYGDEKNTLLDNTMIVSLLENNITIHILENNRTIFGINDECESTSDSALCERVSDFVEKIANYYQFNLRKGKRKISNILMINLSKAVDETEFKRSLNDLKTEYKVIVLDISDVNRNLNPEDKYSNIGYISSVANKNANLSRIDFQVNRPKRGMVFSSYLFVISVLIFALISLVYIPWVNMNQEIHDLEGERDALLIQQTMLADNVEHDSAVSNYQREYNLAFEALEEHSSSPSYYLNDLENLIFGDLAIIDISVDESEKSIIIIVTASDDYDLYNYSIDIYENHGVIDGITDTRWMLYPPDITMLSSGTMKVVIYHA